MVRNNEINHLPSNAMMYLYNKGQHKGEDMKKEMATDEWVVYRYWCITVRRIEERNGRLRDNGLAVTRGDIRDLAKAVITRDEKADLYLKSLGYFKGDSDE